MCPTRHSSGGPRQGQCQGGGSVGSKSSPALPCAVRPGAAAPWGSGSSGPILPHSLCPCRGQLGTLGQDSAQGPGHGLEASERGDRALSPRTVAWPAGAEFTPGLAPGCAAHQRGHSQEQEGAGAWLHAGQDVPAQTKTPQKNRTVTPPPSPAKGSPSLQPVRAARSRPRSWRRCAPGAGAGAIWTWRSSGSQRGTGNPVLTIQPLRDFLRFLPSLPVPRVRG